jgi:outer membrane protein insertion porin family
VNSLKASLIYQFERVDNYNVQEGAKLSTEDEGRVRISSLTPGLILDRRSDLFNPTSGSLHGIAVKEAIPAIGSEADFTKLTLQTSWFIPLFSKVLAALSARAGISWPHGETTETPLHERFYLGGGTTIRGYTQDSVGPTGSDGTPQGGQSMLLGNAELRINPAGSFGVVLFADAGNVWRDQSIRTGDLRASCGGGIRYSTPVGPLRVDYGQKIHRQPGESPGEVHFSLGHVF